MISDNRIISKENFKSSDYFFGISIISKHFILQLLDSHKLGLMSLIALRRFMFDP